jgi:hypothetical protein
MNFNSNVYEKKYLKYKNLYKEIKSQTAGYLTESEKDLLRNGGFSDELIYSLSMQETKPEYIRGLLEEAQTAIYLGRPVQQNRQDDFERRKYEQIRIEENRPEKKLARLQKELESVELDIKTQHERKLKFMNKFIGTGLNEEEISILLSRRWTIEEICNLFNLNLKPETKIKTLTAINCTPVTFPNHFLTLNKQGLQFNMRKKEEILYNISNIH